LWVSLPSGAKLPSTNGIINWPTFSRSVIRASVLSAQETGGGLVILPALVLVGLRGAEGPWVGRFTASAAPSPKTIPSGAPDGGLEVVVLPWPEHAENTSNRIQKLPAGLLKENRVKLWVVIERTRTPRPQCGERRKCRSDRKL